MAMISDKLNKILSAIFGKDVRQALHDGLKAINEETENTTARQVHLEDTFDQMVINAGNSNAEIVDARVDKNTGTSYAKVGDRLDAHSSALEHIKKKDVVSITDFGAIPDYDAATRGGTDNKDSIQKAIELCNANGNKLIVPFGEFYTSEDVSLPLNVEFIGSIIAPNILIVRKQNGIMKNISGSNIIIRGCWRSEIDINTCDTLTIDGSNDNWGTFWNNVTIKRANKLIIDITNGAVSENKFTGGRVNSIVITGDNSLHSTAEAHQNMFINFDISNGGAIQNDSKMQMNTLMNCYFEASNNSDLIQGNWNILGFHGERIPKLGVNSQMLFSSGVWSNSTQDFLSLATNNLVEGGEWESLNHAGRPNGFILNNIDGEVIEDLTAPDGSNRALQLTSKSTYNALDMIINKNNNFNGSITFFVKGDGFSGSEWELMNGVKRSTSMTIIDINDGWRLCRISMPKEPIKIFRLFATTSSFVAKTILISGVKALPFKTSLLPVFNKNVYARGRSREMPSRGIWRVGETVTNDFTISTNVSGWICTSITPLTFKPLPLGD